VVNQGVMDVSRLTTVLGCEDDDEKNLASDVGYEWLVVRIVSLLRTCLDTWNMKCAGRFFIPPAISWWPLLIGT
jgi:hypothetical protein